MKPVAGKRWFYALGQSHEALGITSMPQQMAMAAWPYWAKRAYFDGRLDVTCRFETLRMSVEIHYPPVIHPVSVTVELVR